jgi:hypothetical protein
VERQQQLVRTAERCAHKSPTNRQSSEQTDRPYGCCSCCCRPRSPVPSTEKRTARSPEGRSGRPCTPLASFLTRTALANAMPLHEIRPVAVPYRLGRQSDAIRWRPQHQQQQQLLLLLQCISQESTGTALYIDPMVSSQCTVNE